MSFEDMEKLINEKDIHISDNDKKTVFKYIKTYYNVFFNNPIKYIKMLKGEIDDELYYNILMLYDSYKDLL